jgi:hypothetical protein
LVPSNEPLATAHRLAAHFVILADAVGALVTSLERYDGAIAAGGKDSADKQLDAVKQSAQAAIREHGVIADIAGSLNQAWSSSQGELDWNSQPSRRRRISIARHAATIPPMPRRQGLMARTTLDAA